jgi:hypothetical protein
LHQTSKFWSKGPYGGPAGDALTTMSHTPTSLIHTFFISSVTKALFSPVEVCGSWAVTSLAPPPFLLNLLAFFLQPWPPPPSTPAQLLQHTAALHRHRCKLLRPCLVHQISTPIHFHPITSPPQSTSTCYFSPLSTSKAPLELPETRWPPKFPTLIPTSQFKKGDATSRSPKNYQIYQFKAKQIPVNISWKCNWLENKSRA